MGGNRDDTVDGVDYVCLICPLRTPACDSPRCPYNRYQCLRKAEKRARDAGRQWLSKRQVNAMLKEIGQQAH